MSRELCKIIIPYRFAERIVYGVQRVVVVFENGSTFETVAINKKVFLVPVDMGHMEIVDVRSVRA